MLVKNEILKEIDNRRLYIEPFNRSNLNPNSYDLTLSPYIAYYRLVDGKHRSLVTYTQVGGCTTRDYGHTAALPKNAINDVEYGKLTTLPVIDLATEPELKEEVIPDTGFLLFPGVIYLGLVNEVIDCSNFIAELSGKSKLARAGVKVHQTAGYANLGDHFRFVLEIEVVHPTIIYPNMKIAQVFFWKPDGDVSSSAKYNGTYANKQRKVMDHIPGYIPDPELVERVRLAKTLAEQEGYETNETDNKDDKTTHQEYD